jgi:ArsR family transcriptional regulator
MTLATVAADTVPAAVRALADPVRWRICAALAAEDLCVCHLVADLALAQPLVSHHLRVLRDAGLVEAEPAGRWTYYRLCRPALASASAALATLGRVPRSRHRRRPCC